MHVLKRIIVPMVALGAIAAAVPAAAATDVPYSFNFVNAPSSLDGTGSGAGTVSVKATAWNANLVNGTYTISGASLYSYDGGYGVTSKYDDLPGSCTNGQCGTHQVDNMGNSSGSSSIDFIELDFSKAVSLQTLTRTAFQVTGNSYWDDDFSYAAGSPVSSGAQLSQSALQSMMTSYGNVGGCTASSTLDSQKVCVDKATINSTTKSNVWYIAAAVGSNYGGDGKVDAFKLTGLTVNVVPAAAPEPASWAMMVFGFGAVGSAIRRKRGAFARLIA